MRIHFKQPSGYNQTTDYKDEKSALMAYHSLLANGRKGVILEGNLSEFGKQLKFAIDEMHPET